MHSRAVSVAANLYRRTANGRPYGSVISKRPIIVGASIARPPAEIRKDVNQHASAKKNYSIVTGRADAITII